MPATETASPGTTGLTILEAQVAAARIILLQRRRRMIMERAARAAADIALPLGVLAVLAMVCHATGWISPRPAWILLACSLLVWMGLLIRSIGDCWTANVSTLDAAERMDLAGGSKNRFATAIEFGMQDRTDGLYALAIHDAIQHARTSDTPGPVLPVNPPSVRFKYQLLGFFFCLILIGFSSRLPVGGNKSPHQEMPALERDTISNSSELNSPPRESELRDGNIRSTPAPAAKPLADQTTPRADAPGNTASTAQAPASNSSGDAAASAQSNAAALGASPGQSVASASAITDQSNTAPMPQLADEGSDSSQSSSRARGAAVASGSPSDAKTPAGADGQPESQTQGDNKQPAGNAKQQNQNGGNSSGQKGETKSTGMNAQGAENTESTGGGGSGSGQSGSKKSRGVGMGLLGVRTPDLFKGQELPGPEQQRSLPAAANPSNLVPGSPSITEPRQGDETSLGISHITSEDEDVVNAYFLQLHENR